MSFLGVLGKIAGAAVSTFVPGGGLIVNAVNAATAKGGVRPAAVLQAQTMAGTALQMLAPRPVIQRVPTMSGVNLGGPYGLTIGSTGTASTAAAWPWSHKKKRRRMNYLNLKALRRASRRAHGFLSATRGIVRYYQPHAKKGRPYIAAKRRKRA